MADDKHYVAGDFYRIDDMTGFKVRAGRTKKMWYGTIRRNQSWEPRNAQDFVKGVYDNQTVPDARPRQVNTFIGPLGTYLAIALKPADLMIKVETDLRTQNGDPVQIMTDQGQFFTTAIREIIDQQTFQIVDPMPYSASIKAVVLFPTAYAEPNIEANYVY